MPYTVIRENFIVPNFVLCEVTKIFLHESSLPVLIYTANVWRALEVDENINCRTNNSNTKICERNYGSIHYLDIGTATCSCRYWREVVNNY